MVRASGLYQQNLRLFEGLTLTDGGLGVFARLTSLEGLRGQEVVGG